MYSDYSKEVGERLINRRKILNLTQQEVAERTGSLTRGHLSLIERGITNMTISNLKGLCHALELTAEEIIFGANPKNVYDSKLDIVSKALADDKEALLGFNQVRKEMLFKPLFNWIQRAGIGNVKILLDKNQSRAHRDLLKQITELFG